MEPSEDSTFIATLTTRGRVTRRAHTKMLKAVRYQNKIYFSRHRPDSDWFKNAIAEPAVRVGIGDREFDGVAEIVRNQALASRISALKYPGQQRAHEQRIVIQVTLHGL